MRTEVGLALVNLAFLVTGASLLFAGRFWGDSIAVAIGRIGLAYMAGLAAVMLGVVMSLIVGIPFHFVTFGAIAFLMTSAASAVGIIRHRRRLGDTLRTIPSRAMAWLRETLNWPVVVVGVGSIALLLASLILRAPVPLVVLVIAVPIGSVLLSRHVPRSGRRRLPIGQIEALIVFIAAVVVAGFLIEGFGLFSVTPVFGVDDWLFWSKKAVDLFYNSGLRPELYAEGPSQVISADYPVLFSALQAAVYRAMGSLDTQLVHVQIWLIYIGFFWTVAGILASRGRPLAWVPPLLALAVIPGFIVDQLYSGDADVPTALFIGLGLLLLTIYVNERSPASLAFGSLFLAVAASIKNEGTMACVIAFFAATVVAAFARRWRSAAGLVVAALATAAIAIVPWRIWLAVHGIHADTVQVTPATLLDFGFLADRADRLMPSIDSLLRELTKDAMWLYLPALFLAVALAGLAVRRVRPSAAIYLLFCVGYFAALVWAYSMSTHPLDWHLGTSAYRVVDGLIVVAAIGTAHLASEFYGTASTRLRLRRSREALAAPEEGVTPPDATPERVPTTTAPARRRGEEREAPKPTTA